MTMLEQFQIIEASIEKIWKQKMYDLYKEQGESDIESFDCMSDMEQHIRGLEFRRNGAQMKLDALNSESVDTIAEKGSAKDLEQNDIDIQSSDDRKYKKDLWKTKFNIYNLKVKATKEVYKDLHKKQYIPYGSPNPYRTATRSAVKHWNKAIEQDIQADIKNTLATKH